MLAASFAAAVQRRSCSAFVSALAAARRSCRALRWAALNSFSGLAVRVPSSPVRQFFHQMEAGASRNALYAPSLRWGLSVVPQRCRRPSARTASTSSPAARRHSAKLCRMSAFISASKYRDEGLSYLTLSSPLLRRSISSLMSPTRQAVVRGPSFTGLG